MKSNQCVANHYLESILIFVNSSLHVCVPGRAHHTNIYLLKGGLVRHSQKMDVSCFLGEFHI